MVNQSRHFTTLCSLCVFVLITRGIAFAGGFAILEQSAEGVGNAYAGATAGYGDGSEIAFNPAAMSWIDGTQISHSSQVIITSAEFNNKGSSNVVSGIPTAGSDGPDGGDASYVPTFYAVSQVTDDLHLGLGVNAPFGLKTEYDEEWVGRYHAVKSDLLTVNVNPAFSYKLTPNFSFGAGANIVYADAELTNMVDYGSIGVATLGLPTAAALGLTPQAADGLAEVTGDDWGYGYNFGFSFRYGEESALGISYHSKVSLDLEGDAKFNMPSSAAILTSTGSFLDTTADAHTNLPDYFNIGWIHRFDECFAILAEAQWTHWSRFQELRVKFGNSTPDSVTEENWETTWRYSVGVNFVPVFDWTVKLGFTFDREPIPDDEHRTPRIPGNHRRWFSLGVDYDISEDFSASINYAHLFITDKSSSNTINATGDNFRGDWDSQVDIIAAGVNWNFG